ncbi:MAG: AAA family ATPase [Trebonia sp.]
MRPHRLRVQAFGAFAGTEQVSFDDLEGLFLLHGETGAGKTTLLDAIAFALYGRVPGERGAAKRLRSDHAAPGLTTEVELEATIGGRRLRITRKPEQDRPKKAGAGFTKEQAAVRVDEQSASGGWENKSTRVVEADQEIRDLMGMSAEQFFQVVLLPQGQFAQFLQAKAQEKEELLRKLFSTDRFRRVEDWLAERRRATEKESAAAAESLNFLVARLAQAARVPVPDSAAAAADLPALASDPVPWQSAWASGLTANAMAASDLAAGLMAERKRELDEKLGAQRAAGQLADRQRRRRDALRRHEELRASAAGIERLGAEADEAERAAKVAPVLDVADRAADTAQQAHRAEVAARAAIPAAAASPRPASESSSVGTLPAPGDDLEALRSASAHVLRAAAQAQQSHVGHLEALRAVERQAATEDEASADARARAAAIEATLAESRAMADRRSRARPQTERARDAASEAAAELPTAKASADAARRLASDSAALVKDRANRDRLHEAHVAAREQAVDLHAAALRIRGARIDGMSAELASNLFPGHECPVCGSTDHPNPKEPTFPLVSRDEEDAANALADQAAAAADKAGREVAAVEARIGDLAQRLAGAGGEADAAQADPLTAALLAATETLADAARRAAAEAERLEADAARLKTQAAALPTRQRDLETLDDAIAEDNIRLTELTEQRTAELDKAAAAAKRAQEHRADLSAQLGGALDLDAAIGAARGLAGALAKAADAADDTARTDAEARDAIERAVRAAAEEGFATTAAAKAAARDARWRRATADQLSAHDVETKSVAGLLADPDLDVTLDPAAPVAETTAAAEAAQLAHSAATGAHATARQTADELAKLRPLLADRLAALAPLVQRADQIRQLADLANGQGANQYKMTLSSFVLAARLEEVAAAASQRLRTMTGGRYSLAHSDARRGNSRAGLSLLACDSWTGVDRDTATLSGGETFLASLSLALGLADVVTAEAAGTPMEALFVDEGFGTLDEETLDEVMNVLDGLRAGGRIVGIVSHVTELRQRIPAQVHVAKGRHGSHVTVTAV